METTTIRAVVVDVAVAMILAAIVVMAVVVAMIAALLVARVTVNPRRNGRDNRPRSTGFGGMSKGPENSESSNDFQTVRAAAVQPQQARKKKKKKKMREREKVFVREWEEERLAKVRRKIEKKTKRKP